MLGSNEVIRCCKCRANAATPGTGLMVFLGGPENKYICCDCIRKYENREKRLTKIISKLKEEMKQDWMEQSEL